MLAGEVRNILSASVIITFWCCITSMCLFVIQLSHDSVRPSSKWRVGVHCPVQFVHAYHFHDHERTGVGTAAGFETCILQ